MRTTILALAIGLGSAVAAQADGISGIFQTQAADSGDVGMVQFAPCGDRFCGTLVKSFHKDGTEFKSDHQGMSIVSNMVDDGGGSFSGGTILDPSSNKTYKSKMSLSGSTLQVSGCVAVFCRTQTWTKVK